MYRLESMKQCPYKHDVARCPFKHDVTRCMCFVRQMEIAHHGNVTYYPHAGWLRVGRRLFRLKYIGRHGQHFWDWLVRLPAVTGVVKTRKLPNACFISCNTTQIQDFNELTLWGGVDFLTFSGCPWLSISNLGDNLRSPIVLIWRIQRAIRRFLKRRFEERALAWMMGSHARLCGTAGMTDIPEDISRMILTTLQARD